MATQYDDLGPEYVAHDYVGEMGVAHVTGGNFFAVRMPRHWDHAFAGSIFTDNGTWYAMDAGTGTQTRHTSRDQAIAFLFAAYVNNN